MKVWQGLILLIAVTLIGIVLIAYLVFRPGPYSVENAAGRDYVYSIEPRTNNTVVFWTHDSELGAYCVTDPNLAQTLINLRLQLKKRRIELYFEYKSINNGSAAQQVLGNGCPTEDGGVTMYHVTAVEEASNQ